MSPRVRTVALAGLALASSCVAGLSARADAHQWHAAFLAVVSVVLVLGAAVLVRAAFRWSRS